jgi:uncharacterized protein (DUF2062 family)
VGVWRQVRGEAPRDALTLDALHPWLRPCARLWERAKNEHSTPPEVGWAIALGVFSGCTPFLGFHLWIALALATLFRKNRLWAVLGSRISFMPLFASIAFCEVECGHRLRTGAWARLSPREVLGHGNELFGDWLLGTVLVGSALAVALGLAAYLAARRLQASASRLTPRRIAPPGTLT